MDATDNLHSLHQHEEEVRTQSLDATSARADLRDHLRIISEAMNAIYAFSHDYEHQSDDEMTLQLLGIRLFNAACSALKLALSGYCLTELATRLMHASMHLIADHRGADLKLLATRAHYLDVTSAWRDKYLPSK
jgi:hypothetical protein